MATSKVNHNSGFITISIVILLAGVAIFSGQFIPDYFGGNVIGGPGGGGGIGDPGGGGSGILKTSFDLDWKDSFDFSTNSVFDEEPNYYKSDITTPIPVHVDDITLALANGAGMIFYDPAVKSCSDIALSSYTYGDGIQFSLRPIGSPTWLSDVCIADEAGRVFALELVNIDLNEIAHLRFWELTSSLDYCVGTATACNGLSVNGAPSACERQAGCSEYTISSITSCIGTATACSTFGTQNTCTNQAGCDWLVCQGTDSDTDGYFSAATCGSVFDCNDNNANVNPQAPEICGDGIDNDCSGGDLACADADADGDNYASTVDCNDNDANIYPGAPEICSDGIDQDCAGGDLVCSGDDDNDGVQNTVDLCPNTPAGQVVDSDGCEAIDVDGDSYTSDVDCNDNNAAINPGAAEVCNDGVDNDCNGDADLDDFACEIVSPQDDDNDGVPDVDDVCPNTPAGQQVDSTGCADSQIDADLDTYKKDVDCNDNNVNINPGVTEVCGDGIDNDCSGADLICNGDDDGDGIINANDLCSGTSAGASVNSNGCSDSQIDSDSDTYTLDLDCNDNDATINSGATDVCGDSVDQDCSGEDAICVLDDDNDGVINANDICSGTLANEEVDANGCATTQIDDDADTYTEVAGDCNDNSAEAHPGGTEVCSDALDNDCNGYVDLDDTTCQIITGDSDAGSGTTSDSGAGGGGGQQSSGGGQQSSQQGSSIPFFPSKKKVSSESLGEAQKESALGAIEGTETKDGQGLDFFGISVAAILGSALAVFGYLRYFKPELAKKLFGGSKNSKPNNTTDLFKISNLFKGKSS